MKTLKLIALVALAFTFSSSKSHMKVLLIISFLIIPTTSSQAQVVELVKDINTYHNNTYLTNAHTGSVPVILAEINGKLLMTADDSIHGRQLWTTDGTPAGTQLLKEIFPLVRGTIQLERSVTQKANDSTYLFSAPRKDNVWQLWRTNATTAGTYLLKDVLPGVAISSPIESQKLGEKLFFFCEDGVHGMEPWITDGTITGTTMVKDINPGPGSCARKDQNFDIVNDTTYRWGISSFAFGNKVFFSLIDNADHATLWVSDGTTSGTVLLANNIIVDRYNNDSIKGIGSRFYFYSFDTLQGHQLWTTDGTSLGTFRLTNVKSAPQKFDTYFSASIFYNNKLYFDMIDSANGTNLWVTDGTVGGTSIVKDVNTGGPYRDPRDILYLNHRLYFQALNGTKRGLFKTDGTTTGTFQIAAFDGEIAITNIFDYLIIQQFNVDTVRLWRLDTCHTTPQLYKTFIADGTYASGFIGQKQNRLYFNVQNSYSSGIWVTDGTTGGTFPCSYPGITTAEPFFYFYYNVFPAIEYKNAFYYTAEYSDSVGYELYRIRDTTSAMSVTPCNTLGVSFEHLPETELRLYPNPAGDRLYINANEPIDVIRISNLTGQTVLKFSAGITKEIDVSGFLPGLYLVQVTFKTGQRAEEKFVKR